MRQVPMQQRLWYIKNAALCSWLDVAELQKLADRSRMVACRRNDAIFLAQERSDNVYLIKQGRVKLSRGCAEGREVILDILGPGEIFGELAMAGEDVRTHNAVAIADSLVCIILRRDFDRILKAHPEMSLRVLKLIGLRRRELEMRLEDLIFQPVAKRLVFTLLWQARRHGIREKDGSVRLPLSQNELAHLVGASREAVAEQLGGLKHSGLLRTSYRSIRITDFHGLIQELSPDAEMPPEDLMTFPATKDAEVTVERSGKG